MSVKIVNIPRGFEQDLIRLLMGKKFSLTNYAVNNSPPHDTVIKYSNPEEGRKIIDFIKYDVTHIRGQVVKLDAQHSLPSGGNSSNAAVPHVPQEQRRHNMPPVLTNVTPGQLSGQNRAEKLNEIKRNVRSILVTEKKGLDPMRFVNNYEELTSESLFNATKKVGYRTIAEFCNDNLDCIDYDSWEYGTRVVFHGIPDAKSAHIFQMNQQTKSRNAPNLKPIPFRFQHQFGNFVKPLHKVAEVQKLFAGALEIPDKHRRRIIAVIESNPQGLTTEEVKMKYSEMYEEPFPMNHLTSVTRQASLANILGLISKLKLINNRWVATTDESTTSHLPPEAPPLVPKDPSTSPEFAELRENVVTALKNTPDYTMTLLSLQKTVKIDVMLFGKSSAAELLDLIDDIKVRQSDGNTSWTVHLKHKGQDLSYKVLLSIYETLNSDPNGLLINEFNAAYQQMNGRNLIAADHGYKSLWHLFYNYSNICSMTPTKGGLLLIAETRPDPPPATQLSTHPPGFPEPAGLTSSQNHVTSSHNHVTSSQNHVTSSQNHVTSTQNHVTSPPDKPICSYSGCPPIGSDEISLGYKEFKEDDGFVVIYINVVYTPTEFYVLFTNDNDSNKKQYQDLVSKINGFYRLSVNRLTFELRGPLSQNQLCVYCEDYNQYHRVVIEQVPNKNNNTVKVRSIDTGRRYCTSISMLYRIAKQFRTPCFVRRCALADIRPFNRDTWDPKCQEIFGPKQAKKIYYARQITVSDQAVTLDVIDTHTHDDRCLGDILVAEGYAEDTKIMAEVVNNAPATPNDSFHAVEEDDEDADWLNDWLVEDDCNPVTVSSNAHIDFSDLNLAEPLPPPTELPVSFPLPPPTQLPLLFPGLQPQPALSPAQHLNNTSHLPATNSNLWERSPVLGNRIIPNQSPSDYLRTLMKVGQSKQ